MIFKISIVILLLNFLNASEIQNYRTSNFCIYSSGDNEYAVIRTFTSDDQKMQLAVDTNTLNTHIQPISKVESHKCSPSKYTNLLELSFKKPFILQNDGITETHKSMTITTDLCPSSKNGFEKDFYLSLIRNFQNPAPVTLFITGRWIEKHRVALEQFRKWGKDGNLSITWGNHTYTHPYHPKQVLDKNFALSDDYNLTKDTIRLEKALLAQNIVPSIFFRFPGLVSDKKTMQEIHNLGLITIGSNTWIAKGQKPKSNSIVLLHGNRNEPKGIKIFQKLIRTGKIQEIRPLNSALME